MQQSIPVRQRIISNIVWFAGSLALAFVVWLFAVSARDPIEERRLAERADIQFVFDNETMIMTSTSSETAIVRARGQRSNLSLLTVEDITVTADLSALPPGTHQVLLKADSRRDHISVDTVPRQVTIGLELRESRLVPITLDYAGELPAGFVMGDPQVSAMQTTVRGAASLVAQVEAASLQIALNNQRSPIVTNARLVPLDADGTVVQDVTLEPATVDVNISISQRPDVREVSVQPNLIGVDSLPEGYILTGLNYEPRSVLVSGPSTVLESLPETFFTAPIELSNQTADFEVSVPVVLPSRELVIISGQTINVAVGITAQTANRQFDGVPIEIIGLGDGYTAAITPNEVTLLITGPQPTLDALRQQDLRAILDLNGLAAGTYQLSPEPSLALEQLSQVRISVLPASIDVRIEDSLATPTPAN